MLTRGADRMTREQRSMQMSKVRSKDTKPEMTVRRLVFSMGYRYRLHAKNICGHPDLTFPRLRKVVFVHGCFWHRHRGCKSTTTPITNTDYWIPKFARTMQRDKETLKTLASQGWDSLIIWECELKDCNQVARTIASFLKAPTKRPLSAQHGHKAK